MLEEQFQNIKNSLPIGMPIKGIHLKISRYDIWSESDKEKFSDYSVLRNETYKMVINADTPETAISLLKQLCLTLEIEANKPDVETHWRELPDGTKVSSLSQRNKWIDEIVRKLIIEPAQQVIACLEHLRELIDISLKETLKVQEVRNSPDERKNIFNPPMSLDEVRRWFMQLATNNSTNGKPFLTVEQVEQFIERAFIGNTYVQKLTFNMAEGERTSIKKLFYLYFDKCRNDHGIEAKRQCKEKYIMLLIDNFTNYDYKSVFNSWNNSKAAPKQWDITF